MYISFPLYVNPYEFSTYDNFHKEIDDYLICRYFYYHLYDLVLIDTRIPGQDRIAYKLSYFVCIYGHSYDFHQYCIPILAWH